MLPHHDAAPPIGCDPHAAVIGEPLILTATDEARFAGRRAHNPHGTPGSWLGVTVRAVAEMVMADLPKLRRSARSPAGCAGGSASRRGVVSSIEVALSPLASPVLGGQLLYPRDRAGELLQFDPLVPPGRRYAARALHLAALSEAAIEVLVDHARWAPSPPCEVIVLPGGGALERIAPESSPLAHRDAAATVWVLAARQDPLASERNVAWARAGSIALEPFSVGINLNLTGDGPPERIQTAFDTDACDRLRAIKRSYDPDDLFGTNHGRLRNKPDPVRAHDHELARHRAQPARRPALPSGRARQREESAVSEEVQRG